MNTVAPVEPGVAKHVIVLLESTHAAIREDIFAWYRMNYPREVDGVPKCAGGLYMQATDGRPWIEAAIGELPNIDVSRNIVRHKIEVINANKGKFVTSAEGRFVPEDKSFAIWLGASQVSNGLGIDGQIDAWTGDPELIDHLKVVTAQRLTGRLTEEDYEARTDLDWPGIPEALAYAEQFGLNRGSFISMKHSIRLRMEHVIDQLS